MTLKLPRPKKPRIKLFDVTFYTLYLGIRELFDILYLGVYTLVYFDIVLLLRYTFAMEEDWAFITGYHHLYAASDVGRIYSLKSKRPIQTPKRGRFIWVKLFRNSTPLWFHVQDLVLDAFRPCPEGAWMAYHLDGDTTNNKLSNLDWAPAPAGEERFYNVTMADGEKLHFPRCRFAVVNGKKRHEAGYTR